MKKGIMLALGVIFIILLLAAIAGFISQKTGILHGDYLLQKQETDEERNYFKTVPQIIGVIFVVIIVLKGIQKRKKVKNKILEHE